MSVPVLVGFAGVLVAAVATGMLAGRCVRQPAPGLVGLAVAALALTVALAAQSLGFYSGFGPATFRAVQLFALLIAPLALAWGLAELAWPSDAARFGARLGAVALAIVGGVILATDPLTGPPFSKAWPLPGTHDGPVAHYVLDWVQAVTIVVALVSVAVAARAGSGRLRGGAILGLAAVGVAVALTAALRLTLPDRSLYPVLTLAAAALAWFGATRMPGPAGSGFRADGGRMNRGRDAAVLAAADHGLREPVVPPSVRPREAVNASMNGRPQDPRDFRDSRDPRGMRAPGAWGGGSGAPEDRGLRTEPGHRMPAAPPDRYPPDRYPPDRYPPDRYPPETAGLPFTPPPGLVAAAEAGYLPDPQQAGAPGPAPGRPYGRILIFTLLEERTADFDRLAEQAAEEVRISEPGTLVYVIHLVPNAPLQRIFYEIYADRAAFDSHENQPYMQRFVAERRACVLATNVIELRLKWAKVAPLPSQHQPSPPQASPQQARSPRALEPLPPRPNRGLR